MADDLVVEEAGLRKVLDVLRENETFHRRRDETRTVRRGPASASPRPVPVRLPDRHPPPVPPLRRLPRREVPGGRVMDVLAVSAFAIVALLVVCVVVVRVLDGGRE